jgi:phosphomethylpyrimidine synthase
VRLYDTAAAGHDPREGLPKLRADWVAPRRSQPVVTQLHYARKGEIHARDGVRAMREGLPVEFVRDEVARGRAIIPPTSTTPSSSR